MGGVIQNGGQGQNSISLPVLLTPIQTHSSTLPSSVSSQLATGVWHSSYLLKPNLQAMDSCHREAVLVSDMTLPPLPVHNAWRQSPWAKRSESNHAGSDTPLCAFKCLQLNVTERTCVLESGWRDIKKKKAGDPSLIFSSVIVFLKLHSLQTWRQNNVIKRWGGKRRREGKNESGNKHSPILCAPFTAKQYLRLCLLPWQGDGQ